MRNKLAIIVDLQVTNRNLENSVAQIVLRITNISLQFIGSRSLYFNEHLYFKEYN